MSILHQIASETRKRVAEQKKIRPDITWTCGAGGTFKAALSRSGMGTICEVKKASPSKGIIAKNFPYLEIARDYEKAGADAISVLTEPLHFKGSVQYLQAISSTLSTPVLRKDFVIDPYMIYEARHYGAQAVLLICAILESAQLKQMIQTAETLGMDVLVEAHTEMEIQMALHAGAQIIGVNNRDLHTFAVDLETSIRLRKQVPRDVIFVAESGIQTREDVERLEAAGVDAILVGEALMRADDKLAMLNALKGK